MNNDSATDTDSSDLLEPVNASKKRRLTNDEFQNSNDNSDQSQEKTILPSDEAPQPKPLELCRFKCREKISDQQRMQVFNDYWEQKSRTDRRLYLANLISIKPKLQANPNAQIIRHCNYAYSVQVDDGELTIPVCNNCFVTIFGEAKGVVGNICSKLFSGVDVAADNRGKTRRTKKALKARNTELIDQIDKFELAVCETCGEFDNFRYVPRGMTIVDMYKSYFDESSQPVTMHGYKKFLISSNVKLKHFLVCESCKQDKPDANNRLVKLEIEQIPKEKICFVDMLDLDETQSSRKSSRVAKKDQLVARTMEPLPTCRRNCKNLVTPEQRKTLFDEYWNLVTYRARKGFLSSLISMENTKRYTVNAVRARNFSFIYKICVDGERIQFCKTCFLVMFGENVGFVNDITLKKTKLYEESEIAIDRRGGACHIKPTIQRDELNEHYDKLPTYGPMPNSNPTASCYRYLAGNLGLIKLYDAYKSKCETEGLHKPVALSTYSKGLQDRKLKFFKNTDMCRKCYRLNRLMDDAADVISTTSYEREMEEHTKIVKDSTLEFDTDQRNSESTVLHLYMPSCWLAPLPVNDAPVYLRKLWTFSLMIKNYQTGTTTCYIWDETVAHRGAQELASCLYNYLTNTTFNTSNVIIYSTSLNGLAKHPEFSAMYNKFLQDHCDTVTSIEHKFLETGHISDSELLIDAAKVEKVRKKSSIPISHPYDWRQLARSCDFAVINMTREHFFNFGQYRKLNFRKRVVVSGTEDDEIAWKKVRAVMYRKNEFGIVYVKEAFADPVFMQAENKQPFGRRRKQMNALQQLHEHPLPVTSKKYEDLMEQLPKVDDIFREFYKNLTVNEDNVEDMNPDIYFSDEAENEDNDDVLSD